MWVWELDEPRLRAGCDSVTAYVRGKVVFEDEGGDTGKDSSELLRKHGVSAWPSHVMDVDSGSNGDDLRVRCDENGVCSLYRTNGRWYAGGVTRPTRCKWTATPS